MRAFIGDKQSVAELVTTQQLYQLLGIRNLLTDDEMNINNALKNSTAQGAISNEKYADGISSFHYQGVGGVEWVNWKFKVKPNSNYKLVVKANTSNQLNGYHDMTWSISTNACLGNFFSEKGDIATDQMPLPWEGTRSLIFNFNSQNNAELYLCACFGLLNDNIPTDISIKLELFTADTLQDQIDDLKSHLGK